MTVNGLSGGGSAAEKKSARGKTLTGRTVSGALWTSAGSAAEYVLHGVIFIILARLLSPEDFGIYALASVVVGLSRVFGEIGLGPSLVQRRDLEKDHIRAAFSVTLLLSVTMAGLMAALAPQFAKLVGNSNVTSVIRALSILFVLRGLGLVAASLLQRNMRLAVLARTKVLSYLIGYGLIGVSLAFLGFGYWALVWAALSEAAIQCTQTLYFSRHPKRLQLKWRPLKDLLSYGFGFSLGRLGNYLALKADYLVVGRFLGVSALGIYSRAYELMAMPVGLYQTVANRALFSAVSVVQDDKMRLSRAHSRTTAITALVLLPASIGLCTLAPELIDVALGQRWTEVVVPFQIIALGMFFRSGYSMSEAVAKGTGHVHALAWRQWLYAALVVGGAWVGHFYGVIGVAGGVLVAMILQFCMVTHLGLHSSGLSLREFMLSHIPAVTISVVVFLFTYVPAWILRNLGSPSWVTLTVSALCCLGMLALVIKYAPRLMGSNGSWALNYIRQLIIARAPTLLAN